MSFAVLFLGEIHTGRCQNLVSDYTLSSPLVLEGKSGVVVERLRFRRRLPPGQAAVQIRNCQEVVLRACAFTGIGAAVLIEQSRSIRVEDCAFVDLWEPGEAGPHPQIAVEVRNSAGISVADSLFEAASCGLYAYQSEGVEYLRNVVLNILGPFPRGQAVQFNAVHGSQNRIANNYVQNEAGLSSPQDCVNLFQSSGTPESPLVVEDNYLAGDFQEGSRGKSVSGSGIMAGDGGGQYQLIRNNRLDSPGQVGIGVASGGDIQVTQNTVRGMPSDVSNVGIAVWNQYRQPGGPVQVVSNVVGWRNKNGQANEIWVGPAKYGPAYEFSSVLNRHNQSRFPEEMKVDPDFTPAPWMLIEGTKFSRKLRQNGGNLEIPFDPSQD